MANRHHSQHLLLYGLRCFLSLFVLFTLEILILCAVAGNALFESDVLRGLGQHWVLYWLLALLLLGAHVIFLEVPFLKQLERVTDDIHMAC